MYNISFYDINIVFLLKQEVVMNRIGEVLNEKGIKQTWLADKLSKSYNMVNSYVKNRRQPSLEVLYRIADILNVEIEELLIKNIHRESSQQDFPKELQVAEGYSDYSNSEVTEEIPLLGSVSCGSPMFSEENIESYYSISKKFLKPNKKYFLLRASGDSMDLNGINDGDILLIRQERVAQDGDKVLALVDNEATIKVFKRFTDKIILNPNSSNPNNKPIILTDDFRIQGIFETVILKK
ncbi:MAG: S24 family peptidase [Bacteroidota bacterium]